MTWLSMTGYGAAEVAAGELTVRAEMRSVNQKNREVRVYSSPRNLAWEYEVQQLVQQRIGRGKVDVQLSLAAAPGRTAQGDPAMQRLRGRLWHLKLALGSSRVAGQVAGRLASEAVEAAAPDAAPVLRAAEAALAALQASRRREGEGLRQVIRGHEAELTAGLGRVVPLKDAEAQLRRSQLQEKLEQLRGAGLVEADRRRLEEEITYQLIRGDVTEELDRLRLHLAALGKLLAQVSPVGKALDVLAQELGRETHTLAAKSTYPPLKDVALQLRAVVDQLREQVQNIE